MTRSREEEIEARLAAATPGPWRWRDYGGNLVLTSEADPRRVTVLDADIVGRTELPVLRTRDFTENSSMRQLTAAHPNAAFIAHTPSDLAYLLAQVRGLRKHVEALEKERAERETLVECIKVIGKALRTLRNETRGTLRAHELAIRYDHGNSNWRCLEIALEMADAALGEPTPASKEGV